jgi:uncharacterized protein
VPRPIVFAAPADVDLDLSAISPAWIIEGTPQTRTKCLARSADGTAAVFAWSCTAGRFHWHYAVDETLHILSGEVFVTDEKGKAQRLGPGDMAFFPAGSRSIWHVPHEVRKLAVCRHAMPRPLGFMLRAWNKVFNRLTGFSGGGSQLGARPAATGEDARTASLQAAVGVAQRH